ncbi:MAG: imidazole glycerol phosphate synthase subunit HisH [Gammaproteobacteria bacterium]
MHATRPIVGVLDYQAGNIQSIINAVDHLGAESRTVASAADMDGLSHLILPGVGAFGFCSRNLRATGLLPDLERWTLEERKPILGICVGMQLLADASAELGEHEGLGWGGGRVEALEPDGKGIRIPHVGWNTATFDEEFGDFEPGESADFYFDHAFAYQSPTHAHRVASCTHGQTFCAAIRRDNLVAVQFHPEKSQTAGMRFLTGFLGL